MGLKITETALSGVVIIEPDVFTDSRGYFLESFNDRDFRLATGQNYSFVQDNHSQSFMGVLRGLHYQVINPQGKIVRAVEGTVYDVAVDIRMNSPTFGNWVGVELSAENKRQLWIPPNFAHGFLVISPVAQVLYKSTDYYAPENERGIRWDDPDIAIDWPELASTPILSPKDRDSPLLSYADLPSLS